MTDIALRPSEIAALLRVTPRQVQRQIGAGEFGDPKSFLNERGEYRVPLSDLPKKLQRRYAAQHPGTVVQLRPQPAESADPIPVGAWDNARCVSQKERALERKAIVLAAIDYLEVWEAKLGRTRALERFVTAYKELHVDARVSVDSLQRWIPAFNTFGLDGLVDKNDGSGRMGKGRLPERIKHFFWNQFVNPDKPTVREAIERTRAFAAENGIELNCSDNPFYYYVKHEIPDVAQKAAREWQDDETKWIHTLRRTTKDLKAMRIITADHHLSDVTIHCNADSWVRQGDTLVHARVAQVCKGECVEGHRVWLTVFMDVASRFVLAVVASLAYPNSRTILLGLRQLIVKWGLPDVLYVDNGKDFKSAFGKNMGLTRFGKEVARGRALALPEPLLSSLVGSLGIKVIFAVPRRARSKSIERLFRTWLEQIWKGNPTFVGKPGTRTERAEARRKTVALLCSIAEFADSLSDQVDDYNMRPGHRGLGMDSRSPLEVMSSNRIPRVDPDASGFALAFWSWKALMVGAGGVVRTLGLRWVLDPLVAAKVIGQYVQVLYDQDNLERAIVVAGCEHIGKGTTRVKAIGCSCPGRDAFLCVAQLDLTGTYDPDNPLRIEAIKTSQRINRELRREVRRRPDSLEAKRDLAIFTAAKPRILREIVARKREEHREQLAAAAGGEGSTVRLLPQSSIARAAEQAMQILDARHGSTPAAPPIDDETLDRLIAGSSGRSHLSLAPALEEADAEELERERARIRLERKRAAGECLEGICSASVTGLIDGAEYCGPHWLSHYGIELDPETRAKLEQLMKEEVNDV